MHNFLIQHLCKRQVLYLYVYIERPCQAIYIRTFENIVGDGTLTLKKQEMKELKESIGSKEFKNLFVFYVNLDKFIVLYMYFLLVCSIFF